MMYLTAILSFVKAHPLLKRVLLYGVTAAILAAVVLWLGRVPTPPATEIVYRDKVVEKIVQVPVLTTTTVTQHVTDKVEVNRLLDLNKALSIKVTQLSETLANASSEGSGTVKYIDVPVPGKTEVIRRAEFNDWRLKFLADDDRAIYTLTQRFEILASTGKDKNGQPANVVKMFEIGPGETRTEITDTATVVVTALPKPKASWFVSPSLQIGGAYVQTRTTPTVRTPGAIVALRWLSRGETKAAEDSSLAFASPAVFITKNIKEPGILPVSWNAGKALPVFKDLWVSPYIGFAPKTGKVQRVGLAITASF